MGRISFRTSQHREHVTPYACKVRYMLLTKPSEIALDHCSERDYIQFAGGTAESDGSFQQTRTTGCTSGE